MEMEQLGLLLFWLDSGTRSLHDGTTQALGMEDYDLNEARTRYYRIPNWHTLDTNEAKIDNSCSTFFEIPILNAKQIHAFNSISSQTPNPTCHPSKAEPYRWKTGFPGAQSAALTQYHESVSLVSLLECPLF